MVQANENATEGGEQFSVLGELTLDQNICRIIKISADKYLLASYHLDKASQTKSGRLYAVSVSETTG